MIKVLFPIFSTLTWRANNCVSRQETSTNRRSESTNIYYIINCTVCPLSDLAYIVKVRFTLKKEIKIIRSNPVFNAIPQFSLQRWQAQRTNESWQQLLERVRKNHIGTASHRTLPFPE